MRVSTAEFISGFDAFAEQAGTEPVTITDGGRDRLVLVSADEYARLQARGHGEPAAGQKMRQEGGDRIEPRGEMPELWGALQGTTSWDKDSDVTEPTGEIWDAER